jgi:hypothetical protein
MSQIEPELCDAGIRGKGILIYRPDRRLLAFSAPDHDRNVNPRCTTCLAWDHVRLAYLLAFQAKRRGMIRQNASRHGPLRIWVIKDTAVAVGMLPCDGFLSSPDQEAKS